MTLPRIGILILNRNGLGWLPTVFDSLRAEGYPNKQMFLVDNHSTDGSVEFTLNHYPDVIILRLPDNLGYSMAYNLAMPYAFAKGCEWVVWANNDIRVEPGCLAELVRTCDGDPRIGVLGPGFLAWDSDEPNNYMIGNHPHALDLMKNRSNTPIDVQWVEGSFLMVSHKCVESVGPLDPYLFLYWEEADFCRRARLCAWRVVLVPSALARHYAGGSAQSGGVQEAKSNWFRTRNQYIYCLADPFRSSASNIVRTLHLLMVCLKAAVSSGSCSALFHLKTFCVVLGEFGTIYRKWARDKAGKHPPATTEEFRTVAIERLSRAAPPSPTGDTIAIPHSCHDQ